MGVKFSGTPVEIDFTTRFTESFALFAKTRHTPIEAEQIQRWHNEACRHGALCHQDPRAKTEKNFTIFQLVHDAARDHKAVCGPAPNAPGGENQALWSANANAEQRMKALEDEQYKLQKAVYSSGGSLVNFSAITPQAEDQPHRNTATAPQTANALRGSGLSPKL